MSPRKVDIVWIQLGFVLALIASPILDHAQAQLIDPYRRVTDPRAIVELNGDDNEPLRYRARYGLPPEKDDDGYHILAQDSGAGIITHIWATADRVDSTTEIRLYIDGKLLLSSQFDQFFIKSRGAFRPPLDTAQAGGWVNDVQMPYRDGFKITYRSPSYNLYYAIGWRRIANRARLRSFVLYPNVADIQQQYAAELRMKSQESPWDPSSQIEITDSIELGTDSTAVIADLKGPGMVQELEFNPVIKDPWRYHNVFLKIYYDGSPFPAVDAPLFDFFLSATKYKDIHSLRIKVRQDSSMVCYFPMPFYKSCRIELANNDTATLAIAARVAYSIEPIDRGSTGYFHANFRESRPTKLGIPHPVLHVRGRGKLVGLSHHIPKIFFPVALEGDPIISIDSNKDHFVRYTGGEDYYNGGWWFMGTLYSLPFAGFHTWFDGFYRFHFMDAMDFKESIDFDMQHGVNDDVHDHYRTVAYYYKQWTPFWVNRDTVRFGEALLVQGAGYAPGEKIMIFIDSVAMGVTNADQNGQFTRQVLLPSHFSAGKYQLRVNEIVRPEWTYVIDKPSVRAISDYKLPVVRERDTLQVTGAGFRPGETVRLYLDSIALQGEFVAGSDHRFYGTVRILYLPDRDYHLVAIGETSGQAIAEHYVRVTRTHNFEFEQLLPAFEKTSETARRDNVSFFYHAKWSQQSFVYFEAAGRDSFVTFAVDVPRTDSFNVYLFATQGRKFGDYEYYLDGELRGSFKGYRNGPHYDPWRTDTLNAGPLYLEEGIHFVTFKCIGKNDSAEHAWLGADNIVLEPVNSLPPAPGTWINAEVPTTTIETPRLAVYPNPAADQIKVDLPLSLHDSDLLSRDAQVTIIDPAGRVHYSSAIAVHDVLSAPLMIDIRQLINGRYFIRMDLYGAIRSASFSASFDVLR